MTIDSDRLATLTHIKTVLNARPEIAQADIYPDDSTPAELPLPYVVIEANEEVGGETVLIASKTFIRTWGVGLYVFLENHETQYPSPEDAAYKTAMYPVRDAIVEELLADISLGGTVSDIGTDELLFPDSAELLHWENEGEITPMMGTLFILPVQQIMR